MSAINVLSCTVPSNAAFTDPLKFEITFECVAPITDDLEWKATYVGSAKSQKFDQELDSVMVGPVPLGTSRFVLEVPAPDAAKIPEDDLLGATVVLVTCHYKGKEFIRIGFWVSNTYTEPLAEGEAPPKPCPVDKIRRHIIADKPRVTKWPIDMSS